MKIEFVRSVYNPNLTINDRFAAAYPRKDGKITIVADRLHKCRESLFGHLRIHKNHLPQVVAYGTNSAKDAKKVIDFLKKPSKFWDTKPTACGQWIVWNVDEFWTNPRIGFLTAAVRMFNRIKERQDGSKPEFTETLKNSIYCREYDNFDFALLRFLSGYVELGPIFNNNGNVASVVNRCSKNQIIENMKKAT